METYKINGDLAEQSRDYLSILLLITTITGIAIFGTLISGQQLQIESWLCLFLGLALSAMFKQRDRVALVSWAYIGGLSWSAGSGI